MENKITKTHKIFLIAYFVLTLIGLALCLNYFFVDGIKTTNIIANISLVIVFSVTIWYMLKGYKIESDYAFRIPMFAYSGCVIVMISTATISIPVATPYITASMCTMIVYPIIIAYNQEKVKLCTILFLVILVAELGHACFIFFLYGPEGVTNGGTLANTMNNIHIFVRTFLILALGLSYAARYLRLKKNK